MRQRTIHYAEGWPIMIRAFTATTFLAGLTALAAPAPAAAQSGAQSGGPIGNYQLMQVCTATADPAAPSLPGVAPGDGACSYMRPIAPGEVPPYTLRDYAANYVAAAAPSCPSNFGPLLRANVPVVQNGVTRVVTLSQSGNGTTCTAASQIGAGAALAQTSVQSSDTTTGYGFIMGDSGPNGISLNDAYNVFGPGAVSGVPSVPVCKTANPFSSDRFANSWLTGKSPVATSLPGPIEYATVNLQNITPATLANEQANGPACSTPYVGSFHIWRADWFMFYSGRSFPAVISAHYAQANSNNAGPGDAQQMERTYWTHEFGLSRWEKWTRDDLIVGGVDPRTQSHTLLSHATCAAVGRAAGQPHALLTNPADSRTAGASVTLSSVNGAYQKVTGPDGTTHTWYMTLCADYTNIDRSTTGQPLPAVPSVYSVLWAQ